MAEFKADRILGPYPERVGDRVRYKLVYAAGRNRKTLNFTSLDEAKERKAKDERQLRQEIAPTISELVKRYLDEKQHVSSTPETYRRNVSIDLRRLLPDQDQTLLQITHTQLSNRYAELVSSLSPDTQLRAFDRTKRFFAWCIDAKCLVKNPLDRIKKVGSRRAGERPTLTLSEREKFRTAIYARFDQDQRAVLFAVLDETGSRVGAVLKTRCKDLHPTRPVLELHSVKRTTGKRKIVYLALSQETHAALCKQAEGRKPDDALFFFSTAAKIEKAAEVANLWLTALCEELEITRITCHGLRTTDAQHHRAQGASLDAIAAKHGNTGKVVGQHYAREDTTMQLLLRENQELKAQLQETLQRLTVSHPDK